MYVYNTIACESLDAESIFGLRGYVDWIRVSRLYMKVIGTQGHSSKKHEIPYFRNIKL